MPAANAKEEKDATLTQTASTKSYENSSHGLAFTYPDNWEITEQKDPNRPAVDMIILRAPEQEINTAYRSGEEKVTVRLTTVIYVHNTTDITKYGGSIYNKLTCDQEKLILEQENKDYFLTFISDSNPLGYHSLYLTQEECETDDGGRKAVADQLQLSNQKNTYLIHSSYLVTSEYLDKKGVPESERHMYEIIGMTASPEDFKGSSAYKQLKKMLSSLQGF